MRIQELRRDIERLQIEVDSLKNKKMINFEKTQPSAPRLKEMCISSSHVCNDTFLLYVVKDEEIDHDLEIAIDKLESATQEYNALLKYMARYEEIILIEYLHNYENKTWQEIDKMLFKGTDSSRTKYNRYKHTLKKTN